MLLVELHTLDLFFSQVVHAWDIFIELLESRLKQKPLH